MNYEKLKKTRMKIAYNIIQGLVAHQGDEHLNFMKKDVEYAYKYADEILKQGGYNTTKLLNDLEN